MCQPPDSTTCRSVWQTPHAATRTRTSFGPGSSRTISSSCGATSGAALLVYACRRARTLLGIEGLIAAFVLGTVFGVLVAAAVAAAFALAIHRLPRVGSDA
jgi:hypothetical protein